MQWQHYYCDLIEASIFRLLDRIPHIYVVCIVMYIVRYGGIETYI